MGIFQFVDSISASPDVLLDLNDDAPFYIGEGASISPPKLRRSTSQGLADGTIETGSSYDDRVLRLPLGMKPQAGAEAHASAIQALARILDRRDGAWLKVHADGMDEPRFYRTKRADVEVIDDLLIAKPHRTINLELPAHPFGYGLPETGAFTITNNPLVGENPMMYTWGEVLGDVMTPLHLTFPTPDGAHGITWASQAAFDGTILTEPYYQSLTSAPIVSPVPTDWTIGDGVDSSMVAGSYRLVARYGGLDAIVPTEETMLEWPGLPPGDYRVFIRVGDVSADMGLYFWNRPPSTGTMPLADEAAASFRIDELDTSSHDWIDMGVVAMPGGAPVSDPAFGLDGDPVTALWNVGLGSDITFVGIELDSVILVPAGRPNTLTRHGSAVFPTTFTSRVVTLDGVNGRRYADGVSATSPGTVTRLAPLSVSGGLPVVVPGAANTFTFLATTGLGTADINDDKTLTTEIEFKYFPRYVYERPALT